MKKLFVYRVYSNRLWNVLKIRFYQYLGYQVYIWGEQSFPLQNLRYIEFPSAKKSIQFEKDSRMLSAKFFNSFQDEWSDDIHRIDYIRKTLDMYSLDYYVFENTVSGLILENDKIIKILPRLISTVFQNRKPSINYWLIISYPICIIRLFLRFIKDILLGVNFKSSINVPEIIYFRKKIMPDNGECKYLCNILNSDNKNLIQGIYPFCSNENEKFGFYFISSFKGHFPRIIRSFVSSLVVSINDFIFYLKLGVEASIFQKCLDDTYKAKIVTNLSPSIIFGVLVDKPLYVLMYKYKNFNTKLMSLNESFSFPPSRSFDFNHLDKYYSMNEIDESMQNLYGGDIKSFKKVEFFRRGGGQSKGISDKLHEAMKSFTYKIVIAPSQINVEKAGYYYWAYNEMEDFIKSTLNLAKDYKDTLFIIKGKKGELNFLPKWFHEITNNSNNVFVIHCEKPKELEYNKFEDLIDIADLVIAMALTSTTIWQTISRNKPAIAINRFNIKTPLSDFKGFECDLDEISNQIDYWKSLSSSDVYNATERMKEVFNIRDSNGLKEVAEDLTNSLNL
jgi:hypothetical protein